MAEAILHAQQRTITGKKVQGLRREGKLPANISIRNQSSQPIQVDAHEFERFLKTHGGAAVLTLQVADEHGVTTRHSALLGRMQRQAVTGVVEHIDFQQVDMTEPVHTHISVVVVGDAPAVKALNGVLLQTLTSVEVMALPGDLPEVITIDASGLDTLHSSLSVRDLIPPTGVTILTDPDETVAMVQATRGGAEETAATEATPATPAAGEAKSAAV